MGNTVVSRAPQLTVDTFVVLIVCLSLASCASRPLKEPARPDVEKINAHVGLITSTDHGYINIASWHGRDISLDIAALHQEFAARTFTKVTEVSDSGQAPEQVDLLLGIEYVIATDTKNAMGWSSDTSEIAIKWVLLDRDRTPLWSERILGDATNRPGPVWNNLEKQDERIRIALQKILVESMTRLQDAELLQKINAAL